MSAQEFQHNDSKVFMQDIFEQQQHAYRAHPYPARTERKDMLKALRRSIVKNKVRLLKSLSADYSHRSEDDSLLADILPTLMSVRYYMKNLGRWMKPQKRHVGLMFQPARAWIEYQPLGVVGIVVPWNYPIFLALGPLVAAIAAGNRVMIKLSEYTPYTNRIIREIIEEVFDQTEVAVIEGDANIAAGFSSLPFDHLLFTGSTDVGKHVMRAAANNLTPVTLELGGKSPVLIGEDIRLEVAVERMLYGKCLNAGQTCVAPDYVLCPDSKLAELVELLENQFQKLYPTVANNPDYSAIINGAQYGRLKAWLGEAESAGCDIISFNPASESFEPSARKIPLTLVINPPENLNLMQHEIFGPILPIISYQTTADAIRFIQQRPRPLALYLMSYNRKLQRQVLRHTHAGGVCINDTVSHVAQDDLPFGGIGPSGMGHYHAKEGFLTFSKTKPVFQRGRFNSAKLAFPPYGRWIHKLIYRLFVR
ncbi:coniferyl aldehyde dehydrogenase [Pleionea litopenaei]|uniref:Aldehyde dehydrogenase n=1 Tax=Pleionea litopenaei TaxID=3070815 RepID=A0AA51RRF6_9GAMM|nr:coniferyl aldehyde dehydrogenase [Pleionea sp. HL-JVS1]WMS86144.1 coniferyl aldehyde dehydrogenase [Pleionea sp. HL-JVS1]